MNLEKKRFYTWQKENYSWSRMLYNFPMSYLISARLSKYFSYFFIKRSISPNTITLYMIISGVIGGGLLIIPSYPIKFLATVIIQLWFIFDCSDGEVARYTKRFSKYGGDLDTIAHIVSHPVIGIGFAISLFQMKENVSIFYIIMSGLLLDSIYRVVILMNKMHPDMNSIDRDTKYTISFRNFVGMMIHLFSEFPNVILLACITINIDFFFEYSITYKIFLINVIITFLLMFKNIVGKTKFYLQN